MIIIKTGYYYILVFFFKKTFWRGLCTNLFRSTIILLDVRVISDNAAAVKKDKGKTTYFPQSEKEMLELQKRHSKPGSLIRPT